MSAFRLGQDTKSGRTDTHDVSRHQQLRIGLCIAGVMRRVGPLCWHFCCWPSLPISAMQPTSPSLTMPTTLLCLWQPPQQPACMQASRHIAGWPCSRLPPSCKTFWPRLTSWTHLMCRRQSRSSFHHLVRVLLLSRYCMPIAPTQSLLVQHYMHLSV